MFFRLAKRWLVRCTKPRQPALNENFNLPYGSHVKKHDTRLLIGRIAFLTCGKSDTRHLIGLHRFANENLLCGFSVCKSQYVYNKAIFSSPVSNNGEVYAPETSCMKRTSLYIKNM